MQTVQSMPSRWRYRAATALVLTATAVTISASLGSTAASADGAQPPGAPTDVQVGNCGDSTCPLTWVAPVDEGDSPITSYQVRYSDDGDATWQVAPNNSSSVGQTVTGLQNGQVYDFQIAAVNDAGPGDFSPSSNAGYPASPTPQPHKTRASFAGANREVRFHHRVTLRGGLTDTTTDAPVPNAKVTLERRSATGSFETFTVRRTNSAGEVTVSITPAYSAAYRWYYHGDSGHDYSFSSQRKVLVSASVTAHLEHARVEHGRNVVITGSVAPNQSGRVVHLIQLIKHKWYVVPPKTTLSTRSRYRLAFTYKNKAKLTLAIWFPGDASNARWSSHPFTLHST